MLGFQKSELSQIGRSLDRLFQSFGDDALYARGSNTNLMLLAGAAPKEDLIEELVDLFSVSHPCRFFILRPDASLAKIQSEITALCRRVGKSEHLCTEVIRISFSPTAQAAVPGVVLANLMTGTGTELYLADKSVSITDLQNFGALAERIYYDCDCFGERFFQSGMAETLLAHGAALVDLNWIALGAWREQIRLCFERVMLRNANLRLAEIRLECPALSRSAAGALLAGWIVDRLGLRVSKGSGSGVRLEDRHHHAMELNFKLSPGDQMRMVEFVFESGLSLKLASVPGGIESHFGGGEYRLFAPVESEPRIELLRRYFLIGESVSNYKHSLEAALKIAAFIAPH